MVRCRPEILSGLEPVFPTRVGMVRRCRYWPAQTSRFPHPRGGWSGLPPKRSRLRAVFPTRVGMVRWLPRCDRAEVFPTRVGMVRRFQRSHHCGAVFPTRVGMVRYARIPYMQLLSFPHPRGDGPEGGSLWLRRPVVFPTSPRGGWSGVEHGLGGNSNRFPHPRGDGPSTARPPKPKSKFSPPAWGWSESYLR